MSESSFRQKIRRFARQENRIGFTCSFTLSLFRYGWKESIPLIQEFQCGQVKRKAFPGTDLSDEELRRQRDSVFPAPLRFSILVPLYNTPEPLLREMIESVLAQTWTDWELCLADGSDLADGSVEKICREYASRDQRILYRRLTENRGISENTNACVEMATGDYLVLLDHDDLLTPGALYENRAAIETQGADFLYSDEAVFDSADPKRLLSPHYKSGFAPDDLLANNYICHLTVFRRSLLEKTRVFRSEYDGSQDYDLILRLTDAAEKIVHIPKVLYLWRSHAGSAASDISVKAYAVDAGKRAVRDFLRERKGIDAEVVSADVFPAMHRIRYPIEGDPRISIILNAGPEGIPEPKLKQLQDHTARKNIEWIIAAEGPTESRRLNEAARSASGDYLLFLDRGLTPEGTDWTDQMLMLAQRKETGAVGARIVFGNGRIRHAGIIPGFGKTGTAGRAYFRYKADLAVNLGKLGIVTDVSAVTAECMMIRTSLFREEGGFDEAYGNALFDIDLCMKLREKGYLVVYTPWPKMTDGPMTKQSLIEPGKEKPGWNEDAKRFRSRWKEALAKGDPYYHSEFSKTRMIFRPD